MYFFVHSIGYFFIMVTLRNFWVCQFQSIIFEMVELTFKHWLNNFAECWWDSVIMDLIIANTGGMLVGLLFIKIFKIKEYSFKDL